MRGGDEEARVRALADLDKLRYALAVAREGSFSAAAVAIPLSQSALTRSIQSLEREYGIVLFERGKNGARLTADGLRFVAQASSLLRHAEAIDEELRNTAEGRGAAVSFGIGPVSASTFLPDILPVLLASPDGARVRISVGSNSLLRDLLRQGRIEFYIGGIPRDSDNFATSSGFRMQSIADSSELELLVRAGHPLLAAPITAAALSRYAVVTAPFVRDTLQGADIDALGIQRPTIELDDYGLLTGLVLESDAILVTSSIFDSHRSRAGLVRLALELTSVRPVTYALVSLSSRELSPAASRVAQQLVDAIGSVVDD
ncbi:MAG: transcriptional regulator, LysR-family [Microbacteriaceae bacterium]|nr:transcriptional regulator, LysR-family [Microbacteriaceae bacterium]